VQAVQGGGGDKPLPQSV